MIIPPEVKKKPLEYIFLALFFIIGLFFYLFTNISGSGKRFIAIAMAGGYFFWSLYHHYKRGDLNLSIIVEYLVIILFGIVLLTGSFF
ncbi:MAG: hypothetical protein PHX34_00260 [Candidatus Shapirobacteria bacterium]|nr:hypothetical protein [Candidatus Shapirobacteria bacterium]